MNVSSFNSIVVRLSDQRGIENIMGVQYFQLFQFHSGSNKQINQLGAYSTSMNAPMSFNSTLVRISKSTRKIVDLASRNPKVSISTLARRSRSTTGEGAVRDAAGRRVSIPHWFY
jgi:hypothetical protein